MKYCLNCGAEIADNRKYYSNHCQCDHQQKVYIEKWHNKEVTGLRENNQLSATVRHYLLAKAQEKCERCGWGEINPFTGQVPLEIHHKDGDHANSFEEHLEVLCPNCHALTENFRSRGGGRENRKKYYLTNVCQDCGKTITSSSTRCVECEQKHRKEREHRPHFHRRPSSCRDCCSNTAWSRDCT